jgi:hypothetical protein
MTLFCHDSSHEFNMSCHTVRGARGLEAAYCQQPQLTCKALELAVRLFTAAEAAGAVGSDPELLSHFCSTVLQLCRSAAEQLSKAALQAEGSVRQQLFGLVLSCG